MRTGLCKMARIPCGARWLIAGMWITAVGIAPYGMMLLAPSTMTLWPEK